MTEEREAESRWRGEIEIWVVFWWLVLMAIHEWSPDTTTWLRAWFPTAILLGPLEVVFVWDDDEDDDEEEEEEERERPLSDDDAIACT
jgi:hypothetical protein